MDQIASIVNLSIIVLTCGGINVEHGGLMCANLLPSWLPFTNCKEIWGCPDQNPLTFKKGAVIQDSLEILPGSQFVCLLCSNLHLVQMTYLSAQ
jgi:hypothetical protein